jgi:hypothetical protein
MPETRVYRWFCSFRIQCMVCMDCLQKQLFLAEPPIKICIVS